MKKKSAPVITYTEILNRAINSIQAEVEDWRSKCESFPKDQAEALFTQATAELVSKLEALKQLYAIETGADYE
jgi:hypothetical protein